MAKSKLLCLGLAALLVPSLSGCTGTSPIARPGAKPVMIYDTATGRMVDSNVYRLREP